MNIYFPQAEKRSQLFSYVWAAFAICTVMMLVLSFSRFFEQRGSLSSTATQVVLTESSSAPVAIPAPVPPTEQIQVSNKPLSSSRVNSVPQVVANPVPSVP